MIEINQAKQTDPPHESGIGSVSDWRSWRDASKSSFQFLPSPLQIREECQAIQAGWSPDAERTARRRTPGIKIGPAPPGWLPPGVMRAA